ncbi:MAG: hypothetical protein HFJ28_06585 [Clostridia bacterium]|nr:hypothetical protein [Clostridia bacterium]
MSIKEEISTLKAEQETLRSLREGVQLDLNSLQAEEQECQERAEALAEKKSGLAQKLIQKNDSRLEAINLGIALKRKDKKEFERRLKENQEKLASLEGNIMAYVQEQVQRMVPEFLGYLGKYLEEIGSLIKQKYIIRDVGRLIEDRYGSYIVYTGQIGVYRENEKTPITISKDFFFNQTLYTTSRDGYDAVSVIATPWYKQYLSDFRVAFQMKLKEEYSYSETLSLTIQDEGFTLELV